MKLYITTDEGFQQLPKEAGLQFSEVKVPKTPDFLYGFNIAHEQVFVLSNNETEFSNIVEMLERRSGSHGVIAETTGYATKVDLNDVMLPRYIAHLGDPNYVITDLLLVLNKGKKGWKLLRMQ